MSETKDDLARQRAWEKKHGEQAHGCTTCQRCGCCNTEWHDCDQCDGDGYSDHDCGEDTCCCLYPEADVLCGNCGGEGALLVCSGCCDEDGKHSEDS